MARVAFTLSGTLTFPGPRLEAVADGETLRDALDDLLGSHPGMRSKVFRDDGRLAVSVVVNGRRISRSHCLETVLSDGDAVTLLLPLSGG